MSARSKSAKAMTISGSRINIQLFDFKRGAKITAAGFPVYMGRGAQLERAFINFMLDLHTRSHRYTEVLPPFFVNAQSLRGTGQFPKFADQVYHMAEDALYAIPTAEVPITNLYADEVSEWRIVTVAALRL